MIDYEMVLVDNKSFVSSLTSEVIDLRQTTPNLGLQCAPLFFVFTPNETTPVGTGTITFILQDSADGSTWTDVASYGPFTVADISKDIAFKFPMHHRRYLRVKTSISGTVTALAGSLYVSDAFTDPAGYWRDEVTFFEPNPDAMLIDLKTKVTGVLPTANGGTGTSA